MYRGPKRRRPTPCYCIPTFPSTSRDTTYHGLRVQQRLHTVSLHSNAHDAKTKW
jgi:hypothetical protein